jgi:hypothetical protein
MKDRWKRYYWNITTTQLNGIGVIEIILILVIIIGLILIFKNQIVEIIETAFDAITSDAGGINEEINIGD